MFGFSFDADGGVQDLRVVATVGWRLLGDLASGVGQVQRVLGPPHTRAIPG